MKKWMELFHKKLSLTAQKLAMFRMVCTLCVALGWWGMLYPDFTMTPDTYEVVWEDAELEGKMQEWDSEEEIYDLVLHADSGQIRFKSRLLSKIDAILKYLR